MNCMVQFKHKSFSVVKIWPHRSSLSFAKNVITRVSELFFIIMQVEKDTHLAITASM